MRFLYDLINRNDTSGLKAVINVTAELGDKSITERFTMIKTAVVTSAADKSTWIITNNDITRKLTFFPGTQIHQVLYVNL